MATAKTNYAGASDLSITLASLASDTNFLTGAESAAVDNTVDGRRDYLVSGKITTGTPPTASRQIEVRAVGSWDGTSWLDVLAAIITRIPTEPSVLRSRALNSVLTTPIASPTVQQPGQAGT